MLLQISFQEITKLVDSRAHALLLRIKPLRGKITGIHGVARVLPSPVPNSAVIVKAASRYVKAYSFRCSALDKEKSTIRNPDFFDNPLERESKSVSVILKYGEIGQMLWGSGRGARRTIRTSPPRKHRRVCVNAGSKSLTFACPTLLAVRKPTCKLCGRLGE